jgi:hypothetical protein
MNIESMRIASYRSFKVDETTPPDALERLRRLETFDELRREGCSEAAALRAVGWSRATHYRWKARLRDGGLPALAAKSRRPRRVRARSWTREDERAVWRLRRRHRFMGRLPLRVLLAREGRVLGASTVGRILARGVALGRVRPCVHCRGRLRQRRRRDFSDSWAQRWKYGSRASRMGELVQIDHMTVSRDGQTLKEFRAVCPTSRVMVSRVFSRATARNAARFLDAVLRDMPFPVGSVQVDGGSEFQARFEDACRDRDIPLHVLPPRRPQFNGCVERHNDTARVEFWNLYAGDLTVAAAGGPLADYQRFFNAVRPHRGLDMLTPMQYVASQAA